MRRAIVGFTWTFLLFGAGSATSEDSRKRDLTQPCPTQYRKGGRQCETLDQLVTGPYKVEIPSCPSGSCTLKAGAFKVDITPPPGFPMGGNGFPAQFGRGYWTRLYARAFFFRDSRNQSLALVSCDLGAMSGGLQAKVAEILHEKRRDLNLSRDNLILSATHIHQGPGNFMSFKLYNDMGSPAQGFDEDLFKMLAGRIARAVEMAANNADQAPTETRLVLKEGQLHDRLRNRAVDPFMLNSDRRAVLSSGPHYPCDPPFPDCPCPATDPYRKDCPRFRAVDERIAVLDVLRKGEAAPAASLVFLSVHPEAMSHETQLYQSDFTGLAMSLLEKDRNGNNRDGPYVAGFFNGADGDISVRWTKQNRNEAVFFAKALYGAVRSGLTKSVEIESSATFRVARSELTSNCYSTDSQVWRQSFWRGCYGSPKEVCISGKPMYGVATLGGAEDSRSPLFDLGWHGGVRLPPRDLQGVKQGALESKFIPDPLNPGKTINLTEAIGPPCFYPETIPVSLVKIESGAGALWLGAVPGEPTVTVWSRIEKPLLALAPKGARVLPIGIANEYIGYVTTHEEYAAQAYEGASNIYGPNTAELLRRVFIDLAGDKMSHPPVDDKHQRVDQAIFYPEAWGRGSTFGPDGDPMQSPHGDPDEALENLIVDSDGRPERHWPRFHWPEWPSKMDEEWDGSLRVVEIVAVDTGEPADDDLGPNILTVFVNPGTPGWSIKRARAGSRPYGSGPMRARRPVGGRMRKWNAIWLAPNPMDESRHYFRVKPHGGKPVCSEIFTVAKVMGSESPVVPAADRCP